MFNQYFQNELGNLRELGAEFARRYPAVAPMLSGMSTDPDTERLLEGVAFLTAMLRQRLDDDFPEIIQELFQLIWPHYLRPIPSTTIVDFAPKSGLKQTVKVPKGVQLASEPVDGTPCYFQTCCDVDVHPLALEKASLEEKAGKAPVIRLKFALQGVQLGEWQPERLRIHLTGDPRQAADIYLLLSSHLKRIVISPDGEGESCLLTSEQLKPAGFGAGDSLLPYPTQAFPGYRLIQEYFILPEKFLFLDIEGFHSWQNRGGANRFEICFELNELPIASPKLRKENFALAATPAINLFAHDADPIRLDHQKSEYLVRPSGSNDRNFQVYTIESVTGYVQGTAQERIYSPFEMFSPNPEADPTFHMSIRQSPVREGFDFYLSVAYPPGSGDPAPETLSIGLQCTNGVLSEGLQVGDICHPTSSTPEFVDFRNIRPPTSSIVPQLGRNLHWKLLSHLCLNYRSLASAENLRSLLELYNFEENRDRPAFMANQKKVAGIEAVATRTSDRLVDRVIMRGREIQLNLRQDHFAGAGDMFLFGSVLDHFLGLYASLNTFTQLTVKEAQKGEGIPMAAAHRRAPAHIKNESGSDASQTLLTRAHSFSFFQAMRLLRHLTGKGASGSDADAEAKIRIRPNLSLAFPSSDIESIEPLEDKTGYRITANFLGLYGTASPLPTFYTEDLLEEAGQDESVSRDFLDIFNQSLYDMLYHGWLKYRQFLNIAEVNDNDYLERLYCLLGLGTEPLRKSKSVPGGDYKLLRYIGLFTQHPRSAAGLGAMLSDALGDIPLEIVPCIPRKASIPPTQRIQMGLSGSRIGVDSFLGEEIADRMGKFRIQIGPLDQAGFLQFTPGNQSYDMLIALTESYMSDPLSYEIELILGACQAQTVALGDPVRSVLGVTTWVFSESHLGEVRTRFTINRA